MRDLKEKPDQLKVKSHAFKERGKSVRRAAYGYLEKRMKDRYRREQANGRQEQEPNAAVSAVDQVEQYTGKSVSTVRSAAGWGLDKARRAVMGQAEPAPDMAEPAPPQPGERMKQAAIREKKAEAIRGGGGGMEGAPPLASSDSMAGPPQAAIKERLRGNAPAIKERLAVVRRGNPAAAASTAPKAARATKAAAKTAAKKTVGQTAQARARQLAIQRAKKAARAATNLGKKAAQAVVHAAAALVSALAGLVGGAVLLLLICFVVLVAAVVSSPFGILFTGEPLGEGTVSLGTAIAQIQQEYAARLTELQSGTHDKVLLQGAPPDWREVVAVFAVRTAGAEDGVDVVTLDADRVGRLRAVFWDMTELSAAGESIDHPDSDPDDEEDDSWSEIILTITVTSRTADEMRVIYAFTPWQNRMLDELLEYLEAGFGGLFGSLAVSDAAAQALLDRLPEDLDPERRAVVEAACSLVGKVNYFWGGCALFLTVERCVKQGRFLKKSELYA